MDSVKNRADTSPASIKINKNFHPLLYNNLYYSTHAKLIFLQNIVTIIGEHRKLEIRLLYNLFFPVKLLWQR